MIRSALLVLAALNWGAAFALNTERTLGGKPRPGILWRYKHDVFYDIGFYLCIAPLVRLAPERAWIGVLLRTALYAAFTFAAIASIFL